ncbi:hypothetical protein LCGC14_3156930 [marine sediment metagenome]|uniref:Uncharacterized protein n=1 Tax=marine sediment metagenome TaxID=412755 RepID=A0A0F8VSF7_9ZZZZ
MAKLSAAERAERWFPVWLICALFEGHRSADAVVAVGALMALPDPPSRRTVSRWRTAYNWVERAQTFDRQHGQRDEGVLIAEAISDKVRQAKLGQSLQQLAALGVQQLMNKTGELTGAQVAALAREGMNIERLASGEATEIHAFMESTYNLLSLSLAPLFGQAAEAGFAAMERWVRLEDQEAAREAARYASGEVWAPGVNRVAREHFRALGVTEIVFEEDAGA